MNDLKNLRYPLAVLAIWAVCIFPSVFAPYWCYLDDPANLWAGARVAENPGILLNNGGSGRFRPAYFLYYALLYKLFGFHLWGCYLVQSVIFLLPALMIYQLVNRWLQSPRWGLAAVFFFLTASPVAENAYTLGKAEPMVLLLLTTICYAVLRFTEKGGRSEKKIRAGAWISSIMLMIAGLLFKETYIVIIVFSLSGVLATYVLKKAGGYSNTDLFGKTYLYLAAASLISILIVRLTPYFLVTSSAISGYTTYLINGDLVLRNLRFYLSQTPDVLFVGLAAGIVGLVSLVSLLRNGNRVDMPKAVFAIAFFLTGAAYVAGMLIWRWALGYYMLVPAAVFPVSGLLFVSMMPSASRRKFTVALAIVFILTRIYSIPYFVYIARAQEAQDKIFSSFIAEYMNAASPGERLLSLDWPFYAEQAAQANTLVQNIHGRHDLQVTGIETYVKHLALSPEIQRLYGISQIPDGNALAPRKGDFIVLDTGKRPSRWVLRGISPFLDDNMGNIVDGTHMILGGEEFSLKRVSGDAIAWKGIEIAPLGISVKSYTAGYELYRVTGAPTSGGYSFIRNTDGGRPRSACHPDIHS